MNIVVMVVGFLLIFITGYWLLRSGQPFSTGVLTVHKLLSVALIVYLVKAVLRINRLAPLNGIELIACIVTALLFLGAVASGGVLSAVKTMPDFVRLLHRLLPALTFLSAAVMYYFLWHRK